MHRRADAGVTLVEMLVVLALFTVVAGAVTLAVPGDRRGSTAVVAADRLAAHLERAVDLALATGHGFGIAMQDDALRFVQRGSDARWGPHSDAQLARVKLSASSTRISLNTSEVFAVSADLIPETSVPLRVQYGDGADGVAVLFDGAAVRLEPGS